MTASPLPELHERALATTARVVHGIRSEQWRNPTPCSDWNVHTLLNHIVVENEWVAPLVQGSSVEDVGGRYDGDLLGSDPATAYDLSAKAAGEAFFASGAMEAPVAVSYGPVPGSVYCEHRLVDVVVHGWDLAKATGQDLGMDEDIVGRCWNIADSQRDSMQASGVFGPEVPVDGRAGMMTRLLGLLGRRA